MLKQRTLTAVAMLLAVLPALFSPNPAYWWGLCVLLMSVGAWEWARLNGLQPVACIGAALTCALACLVAWDAGWIVRSLTVLWAGLCGVWCLAAVLLLRAGPPAWTRLPQFFRVGLGLCLIWGAWLAVAQARAQGIHFLLSSMALVWVADVAAYFAGRALGGRWFRRKLAPAISPGKTWEGAIGGALGVVLLALVWPWVDTRWPVDSPSVFGVLRAQGLWLGLVGALALSAMSVVGDLLESLVKRSAGMKDSSGLLPGHGGVLDRVDALLPTLPMAMLLLALVS